MAANNITVNEWTIDEVVGGEDSDLDENMDNSESSEEEVEVNFPHSPILL